MIDTVWENIFISVGIIFLFIALAYYMQKSQRLDRELTIVTKMFAHHFGEQEQQKEKDWQNA